MDEVKENDKTTVSVSSEDKVELKDADTTPAATNGDSPKPAAADEKPAEPAKEAAPAPPAKTDEAAQVAAAGAKSKSEQESELIALNGLLLVALAGGMIYVGTVIFGADSLLFFTGIFVYMIVAPPGTYAQGKSKMVSFTREIAIAFGLTFVLYLILKAVMPADADQAKFFTLILFILGAKLVFNPYYNFKPDDDEVAK